MNPVELVLWFRGVERILIELGAIACVVMGTLLFRMRITSKADIEADVAGAKFKITETAPGLVMALFGGASSRSRTRREPDAFSAPASRRCYRSKLNTPYCPSAQYTRSPSTSSELQPQPCVSWRFRLGDSGSLVSMTVSWPL